MSKDCKCEEKCQNCLCQQEKYVGECIDAIKEVAKKDWRLYDPERCENMNFDGDE